MTKQSWLDKAEEHYIVSSNLLKSKGYGERGITDYEIAKAYAYSQLALVALQMAALCSI